MIDDGFELLAERLNPILDVFGECGVKFALEVHPTEIAFDLYSAERALDALDHREEFGFNFDPSHLIWQGVDPVEFIRAFPDRIYHVHMKDAIVTLNGRSGILAQPPELRRSAPRLGLPLAGPRRRELRGDHPRLERGRLHRPAVGRVGRLRHGPRSGREGGRRVLQERRLRALETGLRLGVREVKRPSVRHSKFKFDPHRGDCHSRPDAVFPAILTSARSIFWFFCGVKKGPAHHRKIPATTEKSFQPNLAKNLPSPITKPAYNS